MEEDRGYWFPAKRFGWGWGPPRTWQGWLVLGVFVALLVAGGFRFLGSNQPGLYAAYAVLLGVLFFAVCWLKGEPPSWRWGDDKTPRR